MAIRIFEMERCGNRDVPVRREPWVASQASSNSSGTSSAFNDKTTFITIQVDEDTYVEIGPNPSATTSSFKVIAGANEDRAVLTGHKVSWLRA